MYQHEFNKEMSTTAVSQLITSLLYYKRFFPYYVHCVVAGIDQDGMKQLILFCNEISFSSIYLDLVVFKKIILVF